MRDKPTTGHVGAAQHCHFEDYCKQFPREYQNTHKKKRPVYRQQRFALFWSQTQRTAAPACYWWAEITWFQPPSSGSKKPGHLKLWAFKHLTRKERHEQSDFAAFNFVSFRLRLEIHECRNVLYLLFPSPHAEGCKPRGRRGNKCWVGPKNQTLVDILDEFSLNAKTC